MAINRPQNYDSTPAGGDFTPVELGGHYLEIKQVSEKQSSTGKDMIVVLFDFAANDAQAGYFTEQFRDDIRPDKKWPNQATNYILTEDNEGNCNRSFKTFITCVENSNPGVQLWNGNTLNFLAFKGKKIGGVFGIVEEEYNGERKKKRKLRWFCSNDKVSEAAIPNEKLLPVTPNYDATKGFENIPDLDDELPFN